MNNSLAGQVGIVTGASAGIGRAITLELAKRGMRLALAARGKEQLQSTLNEIRSMGGEGIAMPTDVSDYSQVVELVSRTETELGPVNLLVNNAGMLSSIGPLWESDPDAWKHDQEVNLFGLYHGCRAVLPGMIERKGGRIVNMTGGGASGPFPYLSSYASGKVAVVRLTENLMAELAGVGSPVKVFVTSPGFVRTSMTEKFENTEEGRRWVGYMRERLEQGLDVEPELAAGLIAAIAEGRLDGYAGRYLRAPDDLPRLDELAVKGGIDEGSDERLLRFK